MNEKLLTTIHKLSTVWWLSGQGVEFETEKSTVQFPASALPSNNSGQVVHTHMPVYVQVVWWLVLIRDFQVMD